MDGFWFGYLTYNTLADECLDVLTHAFPNKICFCLLEIFVEARMANGGFE
jgi:hypothetical protein